jgi:hypothetical protein
MRCYQAMHPAATVFTIANKINLNMPDVGTGSQMETTQYIRCEAKAKTAAPHNISAAGKVQQQPLTQLPRTNLHKGSLLRTGTAAPKNAWWQNPAACYPVSSLCTSKVRTHTTHMVNRHLQIPLPHNHIPCSNTHKTLPCRNGHWHLGIHPLQDINHRPPASMPTCYIVTPACRKLAGSLQEAWPTGSSTAGLAA